MSIERDELARDIFVACAALRMTPREAYAAAEAFLRERQAWQGVAQPDPTPERRPAADSLWHWPWMFLAGFAAARALAVALLSAAAGGGK